MTAPTSTPSSTLSIFKANWPNGARTSKGGPIFGKSAMRCSARPMNTCHCFTTFMKATATMQNSFRRCRSEEHTSELQSLTNLVCRLLLEKKKKNKTHKTKNTSTNRHVKNKEH